MPDVDGPWLALPCLASPQRGQQCGCSFGVCVLLAACAMHEAFAYPWLVVASLVQAVRREVREEAHVSVAEVQIMGTQPWPIGR
jgi:hypothetical protein